MVESLWKPYIGQAMGGKLDFMVLICGVEEQAAVQLEMGTRLRKEVNEKFFKGYVVRRRGDERGFGGHMNQELGVIEC
jgi:hypothetical protein